MITQSPETPHSQPSSGRETPSSPPPLSTEINNSSPRSLPPSTPPPPPPYLMSGRKTMSAFMLHQKSLAACQLPLCVPHAELVPSRSCKSSVLVPPQGTQHETPEPSEHAPPPPIAKECISNISPHCPLDSPSVLDLPPPSHLRLKESMPILAQHIPHVPPSPAPVFLPESGSASFSSHSTGSSLKIPLPAPPLGLKGRMQPRSSVKSLFQSKKSNLKPYHWLKLTRVVQGSLWAEAQKPEEASEYEQ